MNILRLDMKFNGEHCRSHFQWADASGRHLLIILCIQQVSMTKLWNPIGRQHYVEWAQCWSDKSGARGRAVSNINHQSCTECCGVQPGPHSLMTQGLWVLCQHMRHHNWTLYIFICTQWRNNKRIYSLQASPQEHYFEPFDLDTGCDQWLRE